MENTYTAAHCVYHLLLRSNCEHYLYPPCCCFNQERAGSFKHWAQDLGYPEVRITIPTVFFLVDTRALLGRVTAVTSVVCLTTTHHTAVPIGSR